MLSKFIVYVVFLIAPANALISTINFDRCETTRDFIVPWNATLREKQSVFAQAVASLIQKAHDLGYEVTIGEAWRSAEQASFQMKINAEKGIGISASLHTQRLAVDINLFRDGKWLSKTEDYEPLGAWWEKQCIICKWGGRFKRQDGNHFSFTHNGIQ